MEEFEKIDWLPNVEDLIDDKFLDEERLKKESSMYSILNGTFQDPFADIRERYYFPYKKQSPKKTNKNTGNNEAPKNKNEDAGNSENTVKRQRGRPKKKKD